MVAWDGAAHGRAIVNPVISAVAVEPALAPPHPSISLSAIAERVAVLVPRGPWVELAPSTSWPLTPDPLAGLVLLMEP